MPSSYETPSGETRWRALWRDDDGRQRSKTFRTEPNARLFEQQMAEERESGVLGRNTIARETKLDDWLLLWWRSHVMANLTRSTRDSYERAINELISPYLGQVTMARLDTPRVYRWLQETEAAGFTAHQRKEARSVLSTAMRHAIPAGLVPSGVNPVTATVPPKPDRKGPILPLAPSEVEEIRLAFLTYRYGRADDLGGLRSATLTSLMAYGGLRPSEAMGAKVGAVEEHGIWIRDVFAVEHRTNDTKTHQFRFVTLPRQVLADLATWIDARAAVTGRAPADGDWLFPDSDGNVTESTHRNWRGRPWRRACEIAAAALPASADRFAQAAPKTLRSSAVSCAVRAGGRDLDWARLARRFGHTVQTMQRDYTYVVDVLGDAPAVPLEEQLRVARSASGTDRVQAEVAGRLLADNAPLAPLINIDVRRRA